MAHTNYFRAAYVEPCQILGLTLKPFSLGHYFKLAHFESPFVSESPASAETGDLLLAVAICSMGSDPDPAMDEFWCWLAQPASPGPVTRLWLRLSGKTQMTPAEREIVRWGRRCGRADMAAKTALFQRYLRDHTEPPAIWLTQDDRTEPSGAHWSLSLLSGLVCECGYTQHEAYNAPMCKALADYYKAAEGRGMVKFMKQEEVAIGA